MKPAAPQFAATLIAWMGLTLVVFLAIWLQRPPAAVPATALATEFSAERAIEHLKAIARAPRPIGSANHDAARDYILGQLGALGLEPQIQKTTALTEPSASLFLAGTVENILARKRGAGNGQAVLLVAHYDSVPTGPGANDDGVGVATLLETARALTASPSLETDVIFLFTDAEETGLLGAHAFVTDHPWAKEIEVALNLEARGSGGPVVMFETSPQNGALIRALAKATAYPLANSLSYEIYKRLPNDTDLTVFKAAGMPGMNFAYIDGLTHYHTALDNLENVDARTVQHHGSYALALCRYFGATGDTATPEGDAIYFDAFGFLLVRYPAWLAWPLTVVVLLIFGAVIRVGLQKNELTGPGIARGALLLLISLIAAAGAVAGAWWLVRLIHPEYTLITQGDSYSHGLYVIGFATLSLTTVATVLSLFGKRTSDSNLIAGALFWWAALTVATTIWVIGGSYLATWPLFFASLGLGAGFGRRDANLRPAKKVAFAAVAAIPGIFIIIPFLHLVFIAMPFALAPALIVPLVLLATLLSPLFRRPPEGKQWIFPTLIAGAAVVFFVVAGSGRGFDKDHQQSDHVLYSLEAATQRALWLSSDSRPDEWTEQFFGKNPQRAALADPFPLARRDYLQAPAPLAPFKPPAAELLEDVTSSGLRRLRLRLSSPRGAERIGVQISGEVSSANIQGKHLESVVNASEPQKTLSLIYLAPPKEGIELAIETRSTSPLAVKLVDESYGLPFRDGTSFKERPAAMMPAPFIRSDFSLVSQNYSF
jgi:hypothetical protein